MRQPCLDRLWHTITPSSPTLPCRCPRLLAAAVKRLTPARLAAGILAGLRGLEGYTRAAEALAFEMAQEDGVAAAGAVLESCLLG